MRRRDLLGRGLAAAALPALGAAGAGRAAAEGPVGFDARLVTVGNSLIDQSVDMVHHLARRWGLGRGATLTHQTIPGAPMGWNWAHAGSATVDARAALEAGGQDAWMGVESVPFRHLQGPGETCDPEAWARWHRLAAGAGVRRFLVFEAWHDLRSGRPDYAAGFPADPDAGIPWRARLDVARPFWARIAAHVNAARRPGEPAAHLVPGGRMLGRIHDDIAAGRAPASIGAIRDLFLDDIHPNIRGRYAMACVMFACIYGHSPEGAPGHTEDVWGRPFEIVPPDEAAYFQRLAWEIATTDPAAGLAG